MAKRRGISNSIGRLTLGPGDRLLLPVSALGKILLYIFTVLVVSALLAPLIYLGLHEHLNFAFHRYVSRTTQVTAIVLLVPLLLWLRISGLSEVIVVLRTQGLGETCRALRLWFFGKCGLAGNSKALRDLFSGIGMAIVPVALLGLAYIHFDIYRMNRDIPVNAFLVILVTAGGVAVLEELLFRGILLGLAAKALGPVKAAVGVSLVFALVHFLKPAKADDGVVAWWSGFAQYTHVFDSVPPAGIFALGFLSLFGAGLVLSLAALRTKSLWLPIGIHAGWILGQQMLQKLAKYRVKPPDELLPWVGPNVVSGAVPTGIVPLFVLVVIGTGVWLYVRNRTATTSRA
ncbi:hypothetical protein BH09VER1_BH09VER1_11080 [soil metagenome]